MPPELSVVAILAAYNEADIVEQVVGDLIEQGVQVYFLDDGSTDGTANAVERFVGRGVLQVEHLAPAGSATSPAPFDWERILRRKSEIAQALDADWFIHHDADEFRESPWRGLSLRDAVRRVDALGFNAIDFASLDFWPVHDRFRPGDDVRAAFTHYADRAPYDRVQIRCWKKSGCAVDLASSGGHEARFDGRHVFPLRFISRHYPIRGQAHGERKVFQERRRQFREEERARGWHVQYDDIHDGQSFIRDPATMTRYDPDAVRLTLALRHRGVEALEASLDEMRCAIAAQSRELEQGQEELRLHREEQSRYREAHLRYEAEQARYRDALHRCDEELARQRHERDELLGQARAEVDARRADADALQRSVEQHARTIESLQQAIDEGTRRIDELHRSLSWRWMAPARAALRALRGR